MQETLPHFVYCVIKSRIPSDEHGLSMFAKEGGKQYDGVVNYTQ